MQTTCRQPDADAVVHEHLHPIRAPIGEQIRVVGRAAPKTSTTRASAVSVPGAHVKRLYRQPHGVDRGSPQQILQPSGAFGGALTGQLTETVVAPRLSSIRMSGGWLLAP